MRTIELMKQSGYHVSCLISIISDNEDSYMLHTAAIETTRISSEALDIPLVVGHTKGVKESELQDISATIEEARVKFPFGTIASGGIASSYQKGRIDRIAMGLGVKSAAPLWGIDQEAYMMDLISRNYHFILTSVSAEGLDRSWLGREVNQRAVVEIITLSRKYGFNPSFEGGEAETLVLDCPLFQRKKLRILRADVVWRGSYGRLLVKAIELVPKEETNKLKQL
jgi:diphthine-ammonia ligase